jgi:hypothetical protein
MARRRSPWRGILLKFLIKAKTYVINVGDKITAVALVTAKIPN